MRLWLDLADKAAEETSEPSMKPGVVINFPSGVKS
jgi:hypothetical protein